MYWVHKKCSGVRGRLAADPDYVCPRCCDQARLIDNRPVREPGGSVVECLTVNFYVLLF